MAEIVPAVLAPDSAEAASKLKHLAFAHRLHIDIASPPFTPDKTVNLAQLHLSPGRSYDLHLMLSRPSEQIEAVIGLDPDLAIIHFEAEGNHAGFFERISEAGIKKGLALLGETTVSQAERLIKLADHVLVFTGRLGYYGGTLERGCLPKIAQIKELNPKAEVSVDGGINTDNIAVVVAAGADIIISGGFIANAANPQVAYSQLARQMV